VLEVEPKLDLQGAELHNGGAAAAKLSLP